MTAKQTQLQALQRTLLARESVNPVETMRQGYGVRLAALVHRLRGRGWPIQTHQDHNNGMARYFLREGWTPPAPPFPPPSRTRTRKRVRDQLTRASRT